jgi:hypothetical protein
MLSTIFTVLVGIAVFLFFCWEVKLAIERKRFEASRTIIRHHSLEFKDYIEPNSTKVLRRYPPLSFKGTRVVWIEGDVVVSRIQVAGIDQLMGEVPAAVFDSDYSPNLLFPVCQADKCIEFTLINQLDRPVNVWFKLVGMEVLK